MLILEGGNDGVESFKETIVHQAIAFAFAWYACTVAEPPIQAGIELGGSPSLPHA